MVAYIIASQRKFGMGDLANMSAAFDMSSVGGRRTGCGVVANPKNEAMITPPQATRGRGPTKTTRWASPFFTFTKQFVSVQ